MHSESASGMHKMKSNIIMFENPTPKIYQTLPPPLKDVDDVLAFIFTGPCRPTQDDLKRTPLLVRRRRVCEALNWLRLNHVDYHDLNISQENLDQYPEDGPPVVVAYRQSESNKEAEAVSAYDNGDEEGVETGECPYILNGVVGEDIVDAEPKIFKALAAKHLTKDNGGVLAISHAEKPQSIYSNPQLYPMMFPYLFPYGLGGIGNVGRDITIMSDTMHKRRLLMYHDK